MEKIEVPKTFEKKYKEILTERDYQNFISLVNFKPRKSIRINTIKIKKERLARRLERKGWILERIPWYEDGFYVNVVEELAKTLEYYLGYYYIQEAASMIPPLVLDPKPGEIVLDMCAAPGSKTTQMAQMMENEGIIVAIDDSLKRLKALRINIQKMGIKNTVAILMDARRFWKKGLKFEKILLDVPCSGSGTFLTTPSVFKTWSPYLVGRMSKLQKELLISAWKSLDEDGILVYSTCSLDPEENEAIIDFAIRKLGAKVERIKLKNVKTREGITKYEKLRFEKEVRKCVRIWPQDNLTEGFFICRLRK